MAHFSSSASFNSSLECYFCNVFSSRLKMTGVIFHGTVVRLSPSTFCVLAQIHWENGTAGKEGKNTANLYTVGRSGILSCHGQTFAVPGHKNSFSFFFFFH